MGLGSFFLTVCAQRYEPLLVQASVCLVGSPGAPQPAPRCPSSQKDSTLSRRPECSDPQFFIAKSALSVSH